MLDDTARPGYLRAVRDPVRASVTSVEAAKRLGISRFRITELIQRGELQGFGVENDQRTRWYVYADALPRTASDTTSSARVTKRLEEQVNELRESLRLERLGRLNALSAARENCLTLAKAYVELRDGADDDAEVSYTEATIEGARRLNEADLNAQRSAADADHYLTKLVEILSREIGEDDDAFQRPAG